jgi:hypothetical protein
MHNLPEDYDTRKFCLWVSCMDEILCESSLTLSSSLVPWITGEMTNILIVPFDALTSWCVLVISIAVLVSSLKFKYYHYSYFIYALVEQIFQGVGTSMVRPSKQGCCILDECFCALSNGASAGLSEVLPKIGSGPSSDQTIPTKQTTFPTPQAPATQ